MNPNSISHRTPDWKFSSISIKLWKSDILGGFNPGIEYSYMGAFWDINDLKCFITKRKCSKIAENPTLLAFLKTIFDISPVWGRSAWLS